jgi:hypothetical protein
MALGGADAGCVEGFGDGTDGGVIDERDVPLEARGVAELEAAVMPGVFAVALADADAVCVGEKIGQGGVAQEDERFDEGVAPDLDREWLTGNVNLGNNLLTIPKRARLKARVSIPL